MNNLHKKIDEILRFKGENRIPMNEETYSNIESNLCIKFAKDFIELNNYHRYDYLDYFDWFSFDYGVTEETRWYREREKLPHNYLVLSKDDTYFLLLHTISNTKSEVIWCDCEDFFHLCDGEPMEYKPTIFPSFTDFYEFLLDEEEKIRAEEEEEKIN